MGVQLLLKVELKFVSTMPGVVSVTTLGVLPVPALSVANWDFSELVSTTIKHNAIQCLSTSGTHHMVLASHFPLHIRLHYMVWYTSTDAVAVRDSYFGASSSLLLSYVSCSSSRDRLMDCYYSQIPSTSCGLGDFAGVRCVGMYNVIIMALP